MALAYGTSESGASPPPLNGTSQANLNSNSVSLLDPVIDPHSWGFASLSASGSGGGIDPAGNVLRIEGEDGLAEGVGGGTVTAAEVAALREENSSLKKELAEARSTIARITEAGGGGSTHQSGGGGGGVAENASESALPRSGRSEGGSSRDRKSSGHKGQHNSSPQGDGQAIGSPSSVEERASGGECRKARESQSRKKKEIDTARVTDAAVEAVAVAAHVDSRGGLHMEEGVQEG